MKKFVRYLCFGLAISSFTCATIWAQATAQISGTVRDQTGAVLPGVEVTATKTDTGIARTTITNETGSYVLANLPVGPYRVEASLPGFRTFVQSGIVLQVNASPVVNPVLEVGQVSEQIEVQANAALVETRSQGVGEVIEQQRILDLPLNGREVTDLVTLAGAAVQTGTAQGRLYSGNFISLAGGLPFGTDYSLDGANHLNFLTGVGMPLPFPDATQEFKVETSGLNAQRGNSSAIGVVTKSGTNEFHGNLFEFVRNPVFNSTRYFASVDPVTGKKKSDTLKRNQFGGTVGGPIVRDKLFFFGGYQGTITREERGDSRAFVPTPAMLQGDWSTYASPACNGGRQVHLRGGFDSTNHINPSAFSAPSLYVVNRLQENLSAVPDECGKLIYSPSPDRRNEHQYVGKVDWQKSNQHSLFGRVLFNTRKIPQGMVLKNNILNSGRLGTDALTSSYAFGDTLLIGTNTVQNFRLAVNRIHNIQLGNKFFSWCDAGVDTNWFYCGNSPDFTSAAIMSGGFPFGSRFGDGDKYTTYWVPTSYQLNDDVSMVKGDHQLTFGFGLMFGRHIEQARFADGGQFLFVPRYTGSGLGDFMIGRPLSLFQGIPNKHEAAQWVTSLYLTDAWKATDRLTLNLGLRWEPFLPQITRFAYQFDHNAYVQGVKSQVFLNAPPGFTYTGDPGFADYQGIDKRWDQFAPRVGLAWDVQGDGRTSVRSSFALGYAYVSGLWREDTSGSFPWGGRVTITNLPGGLQQPWLGNGGSPFPYTVDKNAPFGNRGLYLVPKQNMRTPTSLSWNLSVQRQVGQNWLVSASYLATRTLHIWTTDAINPGVFLGFDPCTLDGVEYATCSTQNNVDARRLLSLENPVEGQKIGPFALMDDGGTQTAHSMLLSMQRRVAQGLTFTANYTLSHCTGVRADIQSNGPPAGETGTKPHDRAFDDGNCVSDRRHLFNLTGVAETPQFANNTMRMIGTGWRLSGIYRWSSGQPLNVTAGDDYALTGTADQRPNQIGAGYGDRSGDPRSNWLTPTSFAVPALGGYGNVGYNSFVGPASWQFDMALARTFNVGEARNFEFRVEAFNLTNSFRPDGSAIETDSSSTSDFGKILDSLDPRIVQFALKFHF